MLTEFFVSSLAAEKEDDFVHDVVDEWAVSFVYGHSDHFYSLPSPLASVAHVNAFCGIVKFPRAPIKMKTARRGR